MNDDWQMDFALRLKEERERLEREEKGKPTKKYFGNPSTLKRYENATTLPKVKYLLRLAFFGADMNYLFNGERTKEILSIDEHALVAAFNELDFGARYAVLRLFGMDGPPDYYKKTMSWKKLEKSGTGQGEGNHESAQPKHDFGLQNLDEKYLQKLLDAGLDVRAMLASAVPGSEELTPEELALLDNYRHADEDGKKAACKVLDALSQKSVDEKRSA